MAVGIQWEKVCQVLSTGYHKHSIILAIPGIAQILS